MLKRKRNAFLSDITDFLRIESTQPERNIWNEKDSMFVTFFKEWVKHRMWKQYFWAALYIYDAIVFPMASSLVHAGFHLLLRIFHQKGRSHSALFSVQVYMYTFAAVYKRNVCMWHFWYMHYICTYAQSITRCIWVHYFLWLGAFYCSLLQITALQFTSYEANDLNRQILLHSSCGNVVDVICFVSLLAVFSLLLLLVSASASVTDWEFCYDSGE